MTLTSTGPSGFHIRPIVTVLAVAAFVAGVYAISQQVLTDGQPAASESSEAVAATAEPYAGPSGLSEAYANDKFDAALNPARSESAPSAAPPPEIVEIEGQGGLYDALVEGKYTLDFAPGDPGVQYVLVPRAATATSGSSAALAAGKFDAGLVPEQTETSAASEPTFEIVTIKGHGGLYDALIDGKYNVEFLSGTSGVQYVLNTHSETGPSGLQSASTTGQLAEAVDDEPSTQLARAAIGTPTISGGHQQ